ncbi:lipid-A-disaccharide synthase [Pseudomonas guariconensis]|uniref:lipid-A-disaccharide synthase n=1 Tax=Pseudomonas guariconensis TaxID=1288410 RepID=UPI0025A96676|nr:lipid-A-disaccharide synthase [Pseudomonas guariconensis]MDM9592818.1 lipid-A-disaccharide synthase [Pseudomonas guariconensis]MDM9605645.1 lipid-A-disaccharide synthase [Pseudomonas guariconensis]MDM9610602.1 lipid-A-disaccharide synthase [Pseudomonas guariconensis]
MAQLCVALVAGEASGDILGSGLMRALKARHPDVRFIGVGGPLMEVEGLVSYFPMERLAVMGLVEVLGRLRELLKRRKELISTLIAEKPDVFIGIDAPDFTLNIELKLRQAGIKTVHYVSPSVWAWRQKRVLKIREGCDLMLTLFPFEAKFYEEKGVPVRFVGHPLADTIPLEADRQAAREAAREAIGAGEGPLVALMPGSRGGEVGRLGELFLDTAQRLRELVPGVRFVSPCANPARRAQLEQMLQGRDLPVTLLDGRSHQALAACDAVLIASGTATLEALLYKRPMVVAYRLAPLTYWILKRMVKSPYVSLPNLLAQRLLVPELLQDAATSEALAQTVAPLISNGAQQTESFDQIHRTLRRDASNQAAEAVLALLGDR